MKKGLRSLLHRKKMTIIEPVLSDIDQIQKEK